jgi:cysteine sulfinate desulfinase/cysteine desulfurase-like protein
MITNQQYPLTPRIKDKYLEYFGNTSNGYKIGRESKKLLDNARKKIADKTKL